MSRDKQPDIDMETIPVMSQPGSAEEYGASHIDGDEDKDAIGTPRMETEAGKCFRIFIFVASNIMGAADMITDWMIYREVSASTYEIVLIDFLFVFCLIGTLTFAAETMNRCHHFVYGLPVISTILLAAVTLWIEDLPQLVIDVLLLQKVHKDISILVLIKTCFIFLGSAVRVVILAVTCCKTKLGSDNNGSQLSGWERLFHVLLVAGLLIDFSLATYLFQAVIKRI